MNLKEKPFNLSQADIAWVQRILENMSVEEKIGQLFCPIGFSTEPEYLNMLISIHIGGLFFRDGNSAEMQNTFRYAQEHSKIPLLIPSNLEAGGDGAATDGTPYGKQMQVAASGKTENAYRLGKISCSEASALGINLAFAPVVDIDMNFHNPITNVRTYGNDVENVISYAKEYIRAAREENVGTSVKHFPGDGVDERDQHIVTSVNSLSTDEWDKTFGKVYQAMIEEGTLTIMAGHIAMPAYQKKFNPQTANTIIPASLSKELLIDLLRDKLGFNGLIITDATPMVGFTSAMAREKAIPTAIENGCDMILFNKDLVEDYKFMLQGYKTGMLSEKRLNEAVTRILATKAALGLHKKSKEGKLVPDESALEIIHSDTHVEWAKELADEAVTLVKDTQNMLPISSDKTPNILLEILGDFVSNDRVVNRCKERLEEEGFNVSVYEKEDFNKKIDNVENFKKKYDAVIYIGNVENASNKTTNRINWYTFWGQGNNVPWFANEVPTMFISLANPYHLLDVPMIKTYINAYSNNEYVIDAVIKKIVGKSNFTGISPIDPFCNREELSF